jgi:hypothetical protein
MATIALYAHPSPPTTYQEWEAAHDGEALTSAQLGEVLDHFDGLRASREREAERSREGEGAWAQEYRRRALREAFPWAPSRPETSSSP